MFLSLRAMWYLMPVVLGWHGHLLNSFRVSRGHEVTGELRGEAIGIPGRRAPGHISRFPQCLPIDLLSLFIYFETHIVVFGDWECTEIHVVPKIEYGPPVHKAHALSFELSLCSILVFKILNNNKNNSDYSNMVGFMNCSHCVLERDMHTKTTFLSPNSYHFNFRNFHLVIWVEGLRT